MISVNMECCLCCKVSAVEVLGSVFVPDLGTRSMCWPSQGILCLFLIERLQLLTYCSARKSVSRQPFCLSTLYNAGSWLIVVK